MNKYLLFPILLFLQNLAVAQCDFPLPPSNTCDEAPLLCSLDGYCSNNSAALNSGTPNAFCGLVENNNWVAFIAGSNEFILKINVYNCQQNSGLQAQFFFSSDCNNFTAVSNCLDPVFGSANLMATNLIIGEKYYLMMDGKGGDVCEYDYELISGVILSPASVNVDPVSVLCEGGTLDISSTAVSPNSTLNYSWTTADGNILSDPAASGIEVDAPGTYEVFVEDDAGCTANSEVVVVEEPLPQFTILTPLVLDCVNNTSETLIPDVLGGIAGNDFSWTTTTGNIVSGADSPNPVVDAPGMYYLIVTNQSSGCSSLDSTFVQADINTPFAEANVIGELNCIIPDLMLNGSGSSVGNNFFYEWSTTTGNVLSGGNTLFPIVDAPGVYNLIVTNTVNGCTSTVAVEVLLNPEEPTSADFLILQPCFGAENGTIIIDSVIGGIPPYEYAFDGMTFSSSAQKGLLQPADYHVIIRDDTGCEWDTLITIAPQPELIVDLGPDRDLQAGCEVDLVADVNYPTNQIQSIQWTPRVMCTSCYDTTFIAMESVIYTVEVEDVNGCLAYDTVSYIVNKERHVFIPTGFTPNEDGVNDKFMIFGGKDVVVIKSFRVFNRWGELLMEHKNFLPNDDEFSWDGQLAGKNVSEGVFVYYAEILFLDGHLEVYKGDVTLTR